MKALILLTVAAFLLTPAAIGAQKSQDSRNWAQSPESATVKPANEPRVFEAGAEVLVEADPDIAKNDVLVQWDGWRNRVVHAAWTNWGKKLDGGGLSVGTFKMNLATKRITKFADGTRATFSCLVTRNCRLQDLKITETSGDQQFDDLVLASVRSLEGKSVLRFPSDSNRNAVTISCAFRIGKTQFRPHQFNDIETGSSSQ
jgi:hypothetical protein